MNEEKRYGARDFALLMHKVHINRSMAIDIDLYFIVWQLVELLLVSSPGKIRS